MNSKSKQSQLNVEPLLLDVVTASNGRKNVAFDAHLQGGGRKKPGLNRERTHLATFTAIDRSLPRYYSLVIHISFSFSFSLTACPIAGLTDTIFTVDKSSIFSFYSHNFLTATRAILHAQMVTLVSLSPSPQLVQDM